MTCLPVILTPDEAALLLRLVRTVPGHAPIREGLIGKMDEAITRMIQAEKWVRQRNPAAEPPGRSG